MKYVTALRVIFFLPFFFLLSFFVATQTYAAAGINRTINFQGKVVNKSDGTNVNDGSYTFVFKIYDASSGGTKLWGDETQNSIPVTSGIFTVALGSVRSFASDNLDFNQDNLWLDITFNGENFGSRVRLTAVPYAMTAEKVNGLTVTQTTGTFTLTSGKTFSVGNTLTLNGTDSTTFTFPTTSAGTILTSNAPSQGVTSAQSTGTVLGITDSTALTGAIKGLVVTLSGANAQDQTGLEFDLSNASGSNLNDIVGTASSWKVSKAGAITAASIALGTTPAAAGTLRLPNATYITARNAANNADVNLIAIDGSNLVSFGANTAAFTLGGAITGNSQNINALAGLTINGGGTITSATSGTLGIGTSSNTTGVSIGNTSAATLTLTAGATSGTGSTSGLVFADTALTSGTGLEITAGNPKVNANGGALTSGKLINVDSANHTYMSLDNKDLTVNGHKNSISISNIQNTFVYDTTRDADGGRWTADERAQSASWYSETKDHTGDACAIGTDDRCGQSSFPDKAIIVVAGGASANTLYIFDAKDNSLWMSFTQNAGATVALGVNANNTLSSVYALNGKIYVGTNGSAATGMYEINFLTDKITRYNATDARDYSGAIGGRNTAQTTAYVDQARTAPKLVSVTVNDVFAQVIGGKTYIITANGNATAANGGITVTNETNQTNTANLGPANEVYQSIWYAPDDTIYGLSSTTSELDVWYGASSKSGITVAKDTFYDETTKPALYAAAPTFNTAEPDALYVTNGTSSIDGQSNTIYVAHNAALSAIDEKAGNESAGGVKYYNANNITEQMIGDVRGMWPLDAAGSLSMSDASVKGETLTNNATATATSGVRGKGVALNGTSQFLSKADDTNLSITGSVSYGAWFKTNAATTNQFIISKNGSYTMEITTGSKVQGIITGSSTGTRPSAATIDTNWHYGVVVYDATAQTLNVYVDGLLSNGTLAGTVPAAITDSAAAFNIGANNGATFFNGAIDEPFVTAQVLTASEIQHNYQVGLRALQNHSADTKQELSASRINAVSADLEKGLIYAGTNSAGVSVVGMDSDTQTSQYTTYTSTLADDVGTTLAFGSAAINSVSIAKGYGTGNILGLSTSANVWAETNDTTLKDFLASSYNPFGTNLTQTNLNVDRVFRVTNQDASRLDNFSIAGSVQPQIADLFKVDSNGAVINVTTEGLYTNTTGTNSIKGLTFSAMNNVVQNGAGGTTDLRMEDLALPTITQTAGIVTADGLRVTIPASGAIVTGGTMNGLNIVAPTTSGPAAGTLNGLNIGTLTSAGAGAETAVSVGQGWDTGLQVKAGAAFTQTTSLTGLNLDYNSNFTPAAGFNITGASIKLPGNATLSTSTETYTGIDMTTTGAFTKTTSGTFTYKGLDITTPNITQTAGTVIASGINMTIGVNTTGGTQNGIVLAPPATTGSATTTNGLKIGQITTSNGTDTGITVGQGWDTGIQVQAPSAFTQASALTGLSLDYNTNYTAATGQNITGIKILTPAVTASSATTYTGLDLSTVGAITTNGANGTFNGINITTPNITQTANTATANGINMTLGTATTGGTENGLVITPPATTNAGTASNGLSIAALTTSNATATDYALKVGKGWDATLALGSLTANDNTTQGVIRFATAGNGASVCGAGSAQGLVFQDQAGNQIGHFCKDNTAQMEIFAATTTVGTDVAENYSDINHNLQAGDIVALSESGPRKAVVKSKQPYDHLAFGIVSSDPGVTLSGISEKDGSTDLINPTPIALTGRVPAHVSGENGDIHVGDFLTSSSTPGVAMRATNAGMVIGQALENYSGGVGTIEVFARTGYYNGLDQNALTAVSGDTSLAQLIAAPSASSNATLDSTTIQNTDGVDFGTQQSSTNSATLSTANINNLQASASAILSNLVSEVDKLITQNLIVKDLSEFLGSVIFHSDVAFLGRPTFNNDTGGFAVIKNGAKKVVVTFDREYKSKPVVTAAISLEENQEATESAVFAQNVKYIVTQVTTKGFVILLSDTTHEDITFSWSALSVKDARTTISEHVAGVDTGLNPTPTPSPEVSVAPAATPTLDISPSPTASASAN